MKNVYCLGLLTGIACFLNACSLDAPDVARIRLAMDGGTGAVSSPYEILSSPATSMMTSVAPTSVDAFTCIAVNIVGPGIEPSWPVGEGSISERIAALTAGSHCSYPGITSGLFSPSGGFDTELKVPTGPNRLIQVLGVQSSVGCPAGTITENVIMNGGNDDMFTGFYEIGRQLTDLFGDKEVTIFNSYDPSDPKDIRCPKTTPVVNCDFLPYENNLQLRLVADFQRNFSFNNDYVSTWKSCVGPDAVQPLSVAQPKILVNGGPNGRSALSFDGLEDHMIVPGSSLDFANGATVIALIKIGGFPSAGSENRIVDKQGESATAFFSGITNLGSSFFQSNSSGIESNGTALSLNSWVLVVHKLDNAGSVQIAHDREMLGSGVTSPISSNALDLYLFGHKYSGGVNLNLKADVAELILFNESLGTGPQKDIECHLSNKYGLGLSGC